MLSLNKNLIVIISLLMMIIASCSKNDNNAPDTERSASVEIAVDFGQSQSLRATAQTASVVSTFIDITSISIDVLRDDEILWRSRMLPVPS